MGYRIDKEKLDQVLKALGETYAVYAPAWDKAKKNVRFRPIQTADEIVLDRQTDFSTKEIYYPISQVLMYFKADRIEEEELHDPRGILILARACDLNSLRRLDQIFCENGAQDYYYTRLREKVKFALLECREGFENCFCVSMGSNTADNYVMALRMETNAEGALTEILVQTADREMDAYFSGAEEADFEPAFVTENKKTMQIPEISRKNLKAVSDLDYWKQFDERCIGCGGCNTVCGTCSCFDTTDLLYEEGKADGERRRIWSSCMLEDYTQTAGGARSRKTPGANMRFKVFHKFYDYKARFGKEHMCVGCGRCDMRCPKEISFFDTVSGLNEEIASLREDGTARTGQEE